MDKVTKEKIVNKLTELNIKFNIVDKKADLWALLPVEAQNSLLPVVETPATPVEDKRKKAWDRLIEKYKQDCPRAYAARVASGENFTIIPDSFQGKWEFRDEGGKIKEFIY